jgi:hypothetical protein
VIRIGGQNQCIGTVYYLCLTLSAFDGFLLVVGLWNHFAGSRRKEARWRDVTCGGATVDGAPPHKRVMGNLVTLRRAVAPEQSFEWFGIGETKAFARFGIYSTSVCTNVPHTSTTSIC